MMTNRIDPELKAKNERDVHYGDPDSSHDPEMDEIQWETSAPIEEVYPDEFERYLNRFYKFFPKTPVHVRRAYGEGFMRQKGKRNDSSEYDRGCWPDMIARMLDLERWQFNHPNARQPEYFWVAMREPAKSSVNAIDLDNKENVLGHYKTREMDRIVIRPLPILTVEHMQKMKRVYEAFPNHIWCVSSATLGLHIWENLPGPQPLHIIEAQTRPILKKIDLGKTEVHPMPGRPFRRPFGQDYFTISKDGLLEDWRDQLNYFEDVAATPSFEAIFKAMVELLRQEWTRFLYGREPGKIRLSSADPDLAQLIKKRTYCSVSERVLEELYQWAADGFPLGSTQTVESSTPVNRPKNKPKTAELPKLNGKWVQQCRSWAINGLPEEDSIFLVVSNLAVWFYFIEFHELDEQGRFDKITDLLVDFCLKKNNGLITRLNLGQKQEVVKHIERIVVSAVDGVGTHGKEVFARIRAKRQSGGYAKVYYLEPLIQGPSGGSSSNSLSSSVVLTECCSVFEPSAPPNPKNWVFEPDDTPLPDKLERAIQSYYENHGLKMKKPTFKKIVRFINFVRTKGGEARLSVKALKKMGFSNHAARQHIKHLEQMGVIETEGYCPAAGISKLYRLREAALKMFGESTC